MVNVRRSNALQAVVDRSRFDIEGLMVTAKVIGTYFSAVAEALVNIPTSI